MFKHFNPNPLKKSAGDCTIRAISKALSQSWEKTYIDLCLQGLICCDMPSANQVWGKYLQTKGFKKINVDEDCTIAELVDKNKRGMLLIGTGTHVVCAIDGDYYDTWDSGNETAIYYFCKG